MLNRIKRLYKKRDLILTLVVQDIKMKYAASYLGFFWSLLEPMLMICIYSFVFPLILHAKFLNWVTFFICGLISFRFLNKGIIDVTRSLVEKADILGKIGMLPEIIPISKCISDFINFILESAVFLFLIFIFVKPTVYILLYPFLMLIEFLMVLGIGLYLSCYFPRMRDLTYILNIGFQLLMFLVPIIYRIEMMPEEYRGMYAINPFAVLIYLYQASVLHSLDGFIETLPIIPNFILLSIASVIIFLVGYKLFQKHKHEAIARIA